MRKRLGWLSTVVVLGVVFWLHGSWTEPRAIAQVPPGPFSRIHVKLTSLSIPNDCYKGYNFDLRIWYRWDDDRFEEVRAEETASPLRVFEWARPVQAAGKPPTRPVPARQGTPPPGNEAWLDFRVPNDAAKCHSLEIRVSGYFEQGGGAVDFAWASATFTWDRAAIANANVTRDVMLWFDPARQVDPTTGKFVEPAAWEGADARGPVKVTLTGAVE